MSVGVTTDQKQTNLSILNFMLNNYRKHIKTKF